MDVSWLPAFFSLVGDIGKYLAGLPEEARQAAIDAMRAQHLAAVTAAADFAKQTQLDLDDGKAQLDALAAAAMHPTTEG